MELRQLRYFTALAEELNFTRAAQRLHISQPPLSAQIAQLEAELGVKLLHRNSRKVALTEAGTVFLRDIGLVQHRLKEAARHARHVHEGLAGNIELGLSGSHFLGPLPARIGRLARSHPGIVVNLNEMAPSDQLQALREHRIDISISRQAVDDDTLRSLRLWRDPVMAALPPGHRLAAAGKLELRDLASEPFVMLRRETSIFAARTFQACEAAGFDPRVIQSVSEVPAQLSLVEAGLGIALVPASTRSYRADKIRFCELAAPGLQADVHAITRQDARKAAIQTLLQLLLAQDAA